MNQNDSPENETAQTVCFRLPESDSRVAEKIRRNEKITNSELRKAIAAITGSGNPDQEG